MGRALEAQKKYDKAIEKYDEALAIDGEGAEVESQHLAAQLGKAYRPGRQRQERRGRQADPAT